MSFECTYCGGKDHAVSACSKRATEKWVSRLAGYAGLTLLLPAWLGGWILGLFYGAARAGLVRAATFWPDTARAITAEKGREGDDTAG